MRFGNGGENNSPIVHKRAPATVIFYCSLAVSA
jgi:hypothetical protein